MSRAVGILSVYAVTFGTAIVFFTRGLTWIPLLITVVAAAIAAYVYRRWVAFTTVLMLGVLVVAMVITHRLTWVDMKRPVSYPPPAMFPVLVVGKTATGQVDRRVVYFGELNDLKARYATWSFLVDETSADDVKVEGFTTRQPRVWFPSFSVKQIAPGRQRFDVYGSPDDDVENRGWYVATNHEIFPEFYESYGRHDQMGSCLALPGVFVAWVVIATAMIAFVRSRVGRSPQKIQA